MYKCGQFLDLSFELSGLLFKKSSTIFIKASDSGVSGDGFFSGSRKSVFVSIINCRNCFQLVIFVVPTNKAANPHAVPPHSANVDII